MKRNKKVDWTLVGLTILLVVAMVGFTWLVSVGIIKLICMCFGLDFSLKIATGIWLILMLVSSFFKSSVKSK